MLSPRNLSRKLVFPALTALVFLSQGGDSSASLVPPEQSTSAVRIRVRLAEAAPSVSIRGFDLRIEQALNRSLAIAPDRGSEWEFRCQGDRVRAVSTSGRKSMDLEAPVTISSPAGLIRFRGRPYREEIRIHATGSLCEVVNELDIEKYLSGLVNAEFSSQWNEEAVQAQVIAARTYALHQIRGPRSKGHFDVDATVRDQVYDGYVSEDFKGSRAVERTRGMVLLAGAGNSPVKIGPIKAFYHSSCAGRTELPEKVWGGKFPGFKRRVSCPFCAQSSKIQWSLDLSVAEVAERIQRGARDDGKQPGWPKNWSEILRGGKLVDIRAGRFDDSNRRIAVTTFWRHGNEVRELSIPGVRFRDWLGVAQLKSTAFDLMPRRIAGTGFHFSGRGNGHGVGMCQLGAKFLGEKGYRTASILKHYYPDASLRKLW